jgi:large subunit ribosomal protein L15
MPLQRRVPKRGFTNVFRREFQIVNLSALSRALQKSEASAENVISPERLREMGLIGKADLPVKILGDGEMKGTALIKANAFSQKAKEKIEAAGGKVEVIKC